MHLTVQECNTRLLGPETTNIRRYIDHILILLKKSTAKITQQKSHHSLLSSASNRVHVNKQEGMKDRRGYLYEALRRKELAEQHAHSRLNAEYRLIGWGA